jgi:hypothetical protein
MTALEAYIHIADDGTLTGRVPAGTAVGDHNATILIHDSVVTKKKRLNLADLPRHPGPWDDNISLRREDMYGDDGR